MENHPIPQDVTGFQFKLIGDMTVKQFAYLAVGIIFGWIFFSTPFHFIIRFPLALLCVGSGVSFAFLPLEGRPLDVMVMHFMRAIFAPNLYIYQKVGGDLSVFSKLAVAPVATQPQEQTTNKLQQYLRSIPQKSHNKLDEKEKNFFQSIATLTTPSQISAPLQSVVHAASQPVVSVAKHQETPVDVPHIQSIEVEGVHQTPSISQAGTPPVSIETAPPAQIELKLQQTASNLEQQLEQAKILEQQQKEIGQGQQAHIKVEALQDQLNQILAQKEMLEKQLFAMSQKLQEKQQSQRTPVVKPQETEVKQEVPHVRKIPKGMGAAAGLPITPEFPNLLVGIIKDSRGNILPNILVEVKDQEQNPVRAFKTNTLGQFASATPLLNGTYTLVFEDPAGKQKFDNVEITADGTIIAPLEITSTDDRELLRKELFGG